MLEEGFSMNTSYIWLGAEMLGIFRNKILLASAEEILACTI